MDTVNFTIGALILLIGRKLFWFFVGIMGFLTGMQFGLEFFTGLSKQVVLLLSFCIGIFGAVFAFAFQRVAIILAGFFGGGYFLLNMFTIIGEGTESNWLIFLAGGICGALIVAVVFDWALIVLTSLIGAMLISQSFGINESERIILFIFCAVIGIMWQAYLFAGSREHKKDIR